MPFIALKAVATSKQIVHQNHPQCSHPTFTLFPVALSAAQEVRNNVFFPPHTGNFTPLFLYEISQSKATFSQFFTS